MTSASTIGARAPKRVSARPTTRSRSPPRPRRVESSSRARRTASTPRSFDPSSAHRPATTQVVPPGAPGSPPPPPNPNPPKRERPPPRPAPNAPAIRTIGGGTGGGRLSGLHELRRQRPAARRQADLAEGLEQHDVEPRPFLVGVEA